MTSHRTPTPINKGRAFAIVTHEEWDAPAIFIGDSPEKQAKAFLLAQTDDYRDHDEWPDDEGWLGVCLGEGWALWASDGSNAHWDL
jgi:hypothetical protein